MTIEKAKELLGSDCEKYTDDQLASIIDYLSSVANIIINNYLDERET